MNRITRRFQALRDSNRKALIPYITAGDPDPSVTVAMMHAMVGAGAVAGKPRPGGLAAPQLVGRALDAPTQQERRASLARLQGQPDDRALLTLQQRPHIEPA